MVADDQELQRGGGMNVESAEGKRERATLRTSRSERSSGGVALNERIALESCPSCTRSRTREGEPEERGTSANGATEAVNDWSARQL